MIIVIITIIIISCSNDASYKSNNQYDLLCKYFRNVHKFSLHEKIIGIAVLSEEGCLTCNRHFVDFISLKKNNPNILFIITATGNAIDISAFIKDKSNFIFFDTRDEISNLGILKGSGIIFINNHKIDTIIALNALDLNSQINFIAKRINNLDNAECLFDTLQ